MNPRPHHQKVQERTARSRTPATSRRRRAASRPSPRACSHVQRFMPRGRLLDVGCHIGTFLRLAERAGFEVAGVEPSRWAAGASRAPHRRPRHCGAVEDAPIPADAYDAVTIWDVIEHLPDPASDLRAIWPRCVPAASSRSRRWTSTRSSRGSPAGAGRGTCRCTSSTSRAGRSCEMLRREGFQIADVRSHRRTVRVSYLVSRLERLQPSAPTARPRAARGRRLGERLVGVNLGDIFTVVARKPLGVGGHHERRRRASARPGHPDGLRTYRRRAARRPRAAVGDYRARSPAGRGRALTLLAVAMVGWVERPRGSGDLVAALVTPLRLVGRVLVPVDRAVRLRPDDRPRQHAGVLPALAADRLGRRERAAVSYAVVGVIVSNLLFLPALMVLYRLTRERFGDARSHAHDHYLAISPLSFVFSMVYTESLALLLDLHDVPVARAAPRLGRELVGDAGRRWRGPSASCWRPRSRGRCSRTPGAGCRSGCSGSSCPC